MAKVVKNTHEYLRLLDEAGVAFSESNKLSVVDSSLASKLPSSLGSQLSANSLSVVLSSDHSSVSVSDSTAQGHLAAIAGEDFATEATLAAMSAKLPASLGAKSSSGSVSVVQATGASFAVSTAAASTTVVWNAASTGAGGSSASHSNTGGLLSLGISVDGSTNMTVQYSNDNSNWYNTGNVVQFSGTSTMGLDIASVAPYVRLNSTANVTATAFVTSR